MNFISQVMSRGAMNFNRESVERASAPSRWSRGLRNCAMYAGIATGFACTGTPGKATIVEKYTPDKIVGDILLELPKAALLPIWTAMQFDRIVAREDRGTVYQVGAWAVGFTAGLMVFLPAVVGQVAWEGLQKDVNEFRYGYTFFGSVEVREPRPDTSEQELMPTKQP